MSTGITLADAATILAAWLLAEQQLATSQEYEIETEGMRRKLTRADAAVVTGKIKFWQGQVERLSQGSCGGRRVRYVIPD